MSIKIEQNDDDTTIIEGVRYHNDIFRSFATLLPLNEPFIIISRDNGTITIDRYKE